MQVQISWHGRDRILERLRCRKDKIEKVANKAWRSKENIREDFLKRRMFNGYVGEDIEYRLFCGLVFVFKKCAFISTGNPYVKLLTALLYNKLPIPKKYDSRKKGIKNIRVEGMGEKPTKDNEDKP